jgi:hypothetical protein
MSDKTVLQDGVPPFPISRAPVTRLLPGAALVAVLCAATYLLPAAARLGDERSALASEARPYAHSMSIQPSELIIGDEEPGDGLGHIDVPSRLNPEGIKLTLTTNSRAGYKLVISVLPEMQYLFSAVEVFGLDVPVQLPATGGEVTLPYSTRKLSTNLRVRFTLKPEAFPKQEEGRTAGSYVWPLLISAYAN